MYRTLRFIAVILAVVLMTLSLARQVNAQTSYNLGCTITATQFPPNWLQDLKNANPTNVFSGNSTQANATYGQNSYGLMLVKLGPSSGGFPAYTLLIIKPGAQLNLYSPHLTSGVPKLVTNVDPNNTNIGRIDYIPLTSAGAYTGSGAGPYSANNQVDQVCGYTDGTVNIIRTGANSDHVYRKHFPFADDTLYPGATFLNRDGTEPTTSTPTTGTTSGLSQTQFEESSIKIASVLIVFALGAILAYQFRFRG